MDVQVRHGLPGSRAIIDADVESIRLELGCRCCLGLVEQRQERGAFLVGDLEEGADVALGNDEAVARRHRKAVSNPDSVLVLPSDARGGQRAEGAELRRHLT